MGQPRCRASRTTPKRAVRRFVLAEAAVYPMWASQARKRWIRAAAAGLRACRELGSPQQEVMQGTKNQGVGARRRMLASSSARRVVCAEVHQPQTYPSPSHSTYSSRNCYVAVLGRAQAAPGEHRMLAEMDDEAPDRKSPVVAAAAEQAQAYCLAAAVGSTAGGCCCDYHPAPSP